MFGQKINDAELKFAIQKNITNSIYHEELQRGHELIIRGDYDKAYSVFQKNRKTKNVLPAILTYISMIEYVRGNYLYSSQLCDSAISLLSSAKTNTYYCRALNFKAKAISALGKNEEAIKLVQQAINLSEKYNDKFMMASSYYYMGVFLSETSKHQDAMMYFTKSENLCKQLNDKINLAASLSFKGLSLSHLGKYSDAVEMLNESILIRSELGDKRGLANSFLNMNKIYTELGDKEKRLEYEKKSLKICEEINDQQCISGRLTNIGDIYFLEKNYKKALEYQFKAQKIALKLGIKYRVAEISFHIAEIYNAQGRYSLALTQIDSSLSLRSENKDNEGAANARILKAKILLNLEKFLDAQFEAEKAYQIGNEFNLIHIKRDAHEILSIIYEKNGDLTKALFHLKNYQILKDSLFNIEKSKVFIRKEIESKYQIKEIDEKKKQALKELQIANEKERFQRLMWFGFFIILSLIALFYLFYSKYQTQKKANVISKKNQLLNNQIVELEKQSIFYQTIATVAHELNTPLGVINAGNNELKTLVNKQNQRVLDSFSINDSKFIELWSNVICRSVEHESGFKKRKEANDVYNYCIEKKLIQLGDPTQVALMVSHWNLEEKLNEFLDQIIKTENPKEILDYLDMSRKSNLIDNAIHKAISTSKVVVGELNQLAENQSKAIVIQEVKIAQLIKQITELNPKLRESNIQIANNISRDLSIFIDEKQLIQMFTILIQNAMEAFDNSKNRKEICFNSRQQDDFQTISISNNGPKISLDNSDKIFDRFFTTKNKKDHRGLGLSILKQSIESFGGLISVESNDSQTTFHLKFRNVKNKPV